MLQEMKIGTMHKVTLPLTNDPHSFFIRSRKWDRRLKTLENQPFLRNPPTDMINYGMVVLYKSNIIKKFVRGRILYIHSRMNTNCNLDLLAIDYGFVERAIPLSDVGLIGNIKEFPPLAVQCRLDQCEPIGTSFSPDVINIFKSFLQHDSAIIKVTGKTHDRMLVEVQTRDIHDVATFMSRIDFTVLWKPSTANTMPNSTDPNNLDFSILSFKEKPLEYRHKMMDPGATFRGRVQAGESLSSFFVADIMEINRLALKEPPLLKDCHDKQMPFNEIEPGKNCAIKIRDSLYERAIIKEITEPGLRVTVVLVDWGMVYNTTFDCVRSVTPEDFKQPILAEFCTTDPNQVREYNLQNIVSPGNEYIVLGITSLWPPREYKTSAHRASRSFFLPLAVSESTPCPRPIFFN